jgi:haloalkane dehalogenase
MSWPAISRRGVLSAAHFNSAPSWPSQHSVIVHGSHFLQEEAPEAVGEAAARSVAKVLAGQVSAEG